MKKFQNVRSYAIILVTNSDNMLIFGGGNRTI